VLRLHDLQELLSLHNFVNTVRSPARVTKDTVSLIYVIITNKDSIGELATVMDLRYLDHKAQILQLNVKTIVRKCKKIKLWQEVFQTSEVNSALQVLRDIFGYYFNIAFPYKLINSSKMYNSKWITNGTKISSKKCVF
jgi:hypothetical protein